MSPSHKLKLRKTDRIGFVAAEEDAELLNFVFVNNEDEIDVLLDPSDPRSIILGRTGAGKTALLLRIKTVGERVIDIRPENLAIEHVANSTILRFLTDDLDVRLDVFFKLLWRHVFAVELIKRRFDITSEVESNEFFANVVTGFFRREEDRRALGYLQRYGSSFWQETDTRVREVTTTVEKNFEASIGITPSELAKLRIGDKSDFSEERKAEIKHRAYQVISGVQARRLTEIVGVVESVLDDPQKIYYISIDKLDENWVDDQLRYKLIRALLETVREFNADVYSLKANVALRLDLIKRVFEATKDTGFQEEKYESLYVPLEWSRGKLTELLDFRVGYLFKSKYTKQQVRHEHVLPNQVDGERAIDYILDRTLMRPRDVIMFFNQCIISLREEASISADIIRQAEVGYSHSRLLSLGDEWRADYPHLIDFTRILRLREKEFVLSEVERDDLHDLCMQVATLHDIFDASIPRLSISANAKDFLNENISSDVFRRYLFMSFFRIGLVGVKAENYNGFRWSNSYYSSVSEFDLEENTIVAIQPTFWNALGIRLNE